MNDNSKPLKRAVTVEQLEIRDAYSNWIASLPWDYFLTITFREPCPMRRQESVTHAVGQTLKSRYEPIENLALFAEPHKSSNLHLHGLVKMADFTPEILSHCRRDMQQFLSDKFGRSQAAFPRQVGDVAKYVAKYCTKGQGYYEFF